MTQGIKYMVGVNRRTRSSTVRSALAATATIALMPAVIAAGQGNPQVSDPAGAQQIIRSDTRTSAVGSGENFTGQVHVEPLFPATREINASGAYVTFEPGAHSAWHTHPAGQRLVVTSGIGRVQEWGKPVQVVRPGDVVVCPPGVKHWHGAAPDSAMTHLAITGSRHGKSAIWMEKVTGAQYNAH